MNVWADLSALIWPVVLVGGLVLTAAGLVLLRRSSRAAPTATDDPASPRPASSARAVLDERLARGEIDVAEHARRAAVLDEQ